MRGELAVIVAPRRFWRRRHDIDARLQITERRIDRECRGDVLVERGSGRKLARPDFYAALGAEAGKLISAQAALEIAIDHGVDQVAIADPEHVDGDRRCVDADERNAALAGARQHIGAAGKMHERFSVADIDVELGRFRQGLFHRRRQAGAQIDVVALAMLQPVNAELLAFRGQRGLVGTGQREVRRKVDALGELFGELEASPRRRRVRIHSVIHEAEAILVAQLFILGTDVGDLARVERHPQRIQRRPPQLAFGQGPAEHGERIRLVASVSGALVGEIGRGRGAFQEEGLLARIGGPDLEDGAGEPQPVATILRRGGGDLPEDLQAGAEVVALEGGVGVAS